MKIVKIKSALILLLVFIFHSGIYSQSYRNAFPYFYDIKPLDVNYIDMPFNNYGFLSMTNNNYPPVIWSRFASDMVVYEEGLFFIGKINKEIYLSEAMWGSQYSPGPIIDNKAAMISHPEDSVKYRVYKITKGDKSNTNIDVSQWPFQWGAPSAGDNKIKLFDDQMLWTVYNGFDPNGKAPVSPARVKYPPQPVEVHQNAFAFNKNNGSLPGYLGDVVFLEYTVINKGKD